MLELVEWLVLVATLPSANTAARMRLWRAVKALGCASLRDGVYLLPARTDTGEALRTLAADARAAGGSAEVLHVAADAAQDEAFRRAFDRGDDYARLVGAIRAALPAADAKAAQQLEREFKAVAATDYFPAEARRQAEAALAELAAAAGGEPRAAEGAIRRLAATDFRGRTWATRKGLWVDRMASAWLIRRFIDPEADFLWLDEARRCPKDALGFDFDGARFTHVGQRVSFEVIAASFGLEDDAALLRIGAIVHCLDVGGVPVPEAPGIEAVLAGLRATAGGDDALFHEASRVFDGLYNNYRQESPND